MENWVSLDLEQMVLNQNGGTKKERGSELPGTMRKVLEPTLQGGDIAEMEMMDRRGVGDGCRGRQGHSRQTARVRR